MELAATVTSEFTLHRLSAYLALKGRTANGARSLIPYALEKDTANYTRLCALELLSQHTREEGGEPDVERLDGIFEVLGVRGVRDFWLRASEGGDGGLGEVTGEREAAQLSDAARDAIRALAETSAYNLHYLFSTSPYIQSPRCIWPAMSLGPLNGVLSFSFSYSFSFNY